MNKYLQCLLSTPLIMALSENTRKEIINLLDDHNESEIEAFIIGKIGADNIDLLSLQLKTESKKNGWDFKSVIKNAQKTHKRRKMHDLFAEDPSSLQGKLLRIDGPVPFEYQVILVEQNQQWQHSGQWTLHLQDDAKAILHHQGPILTRVALEFFETRDPLQFIKSYILSANKPYYIVKILGDNNELPSSAAGYSLQYYTSSPEKKMVGVNVMPGSSIGRRFHYVHKFILKNRSVNIELSQPNIFILEVTCGEDRQSIVAVRLLNRDGEDFGFTQEKFQRLTWKVQETKNFSRHEYENIAVREKVLSGDEIKLRKLEKIEQLKDDVVFSLLRDEQHAVLDEIINTIVHYPDDHSQIMRKYFQTEFLPSSVRFIVQKKIIEIKFIIDSLHEDSSQRFDLTTLFLKLVFTANYLRWLTRNESLSVMKAMELFNQFKDELNELKGKKLVLFLGNTGAGKSTSINFLLRNPLKQERVLGENVLRIDEEKINIEGVSRNVARIGQSLGTSETAFTKGFSIPSDLLEELAEEDIQGLENYRLVDTPGFSDTRGVNYRILTMLSIQQTIQSSENILAAVLVVPYNTLTVDRSGPMVDLFHSFEQMLPNAFQLTSAGMNSVDANSVHVLITKCNNPSEMESFFEKRVETLLAEDREQVRKQREAGATLDANDTDRRINLWKVLLNLSRNGQVIYVDIDDYIQRADVLVQILKSRGIEKRHVRNIFEKEDLKKQLADYVNLSANTNISIMRSFLEGLPEHIVKRQFEISLKDMNINEHQQEINQRAERIRDLEEKIFKTEEEKSRFEAADLSDPEICAQLAAKVKELQDDQFREEQLDIQSLESDTRRKKQKMKKLMEEIDEKSIHIRRLQNEEQRLRQEIVRLQTGSTTEPLHRDGPEDLMGTMTIKNWKEGAASTAFDETRKTTDADFVEGSSRIVKVSEYRGTLLQHAYISKEYYIVPNDENERVALLGLQQSGQYRAIIEGVNYKILGAKASDRYTMVYQYNLTYDGSVSPYFAIQHVIPNCDRNRSTVQNTYATIEATETAISRYEAESSDLGRDYSVLENEARQLERQLQEKKRDFGNNQRVLALQGLVNNILRLRQVIETLKSSTLYAQERILNLTKERQVSYSWLDYLLMKRVNFALIIADQRDVMESLNQFCELVLQSELMGAHTAPSGFMQQCAEYMEYYRRHRDQLQVECTQELVDGAIRPIMQNDLFYSLFNIDMVSWSSFRSMLPVPNMTVINDPNPEAFLVHPESDLQKGASHNVSTKKWQEELRKLLHHRIEDEASEDIDRFAVQVRNYGFVPIDTNRDGNCFFYAIEDQLKTRGIQPDAFSDALRERAAAYMVEEQEQFLPFIEALDENGAEGYLSKAFENGEWADDPIIRALASAMGWTFVIIRLDGAPPTIVNGGVEGQPILYVGYLGAHYVSLHGEPNLVTLALTVKNIVSDESDVIDESDIIMSEVALSEQNDASGDHEGLTAYFSGMETKDTNSGIQLFSARSVSTLSDSELPKLGPVIKSPSYVSGSEVLPDNPIVSLSLKQDIHTLQGNGYSFTAETQGEGLVSIQVRSPSISEGDSADCLTRTKIEFNNRVHANSGSIELVEEDRTQATGRWLVRGSSAFIAQMTQELRALAPEDSESEKTAANITCVLS